MKKSLILLSLTQVVAANEIFDLSLEELLNVKVTVSSREEESILDTSSIVSKSTRKDWKDIVINRSYDSNRFIAGYAQSAFTGAQAFGFRGFLTGSTYKKTATLIDGISLNNYIFAGNVLGGVGSIHTDILDSQEVIRGSGSHLYGTEALLGVFNYHSYNSKKDDLEANAEMGTLGYSNYSLRFTKNWNKFRFNVAMAKRKATKQDVERKFTETSGVSSTTQNYWYDSRSIVFKTHFKKTSFSFYYNGLMRDDWPSAERSGRTAPTSSSLGPRDMYLYVLKDSSKLSKELKLDTKVYINTLRSNSISTIAGVGHPSSTLSTGISSSLNKERHKGLQATLFYSPEFLKELNIVLHGESITKKVLGYTSSNTFLGSTILSNGQKRINNSLSTDISYKLNKFKFSFGARHDHYVGEESHFSPRYTLVYKLNKDNSLKYLYSKAFKAPAFLDSEGTPAFNFLANDSLKNEEIDTYEVAWVRKSSNYTLSSNLYFNNMKNRHEVVVVSSKNQTVNSTDDNKTSGLEIEHEYHTNGLTLRNAFSYSFKRVNKAYAKTLWNWGLTYKMTKIPMKVTLMGDHLFGYNTSAVSKANSVEPSYESHEFKLDLNLIYNLKSYNADLSLKASNLFDTHYVLPSLQAVNGGMLMPGRMVIVGLNKRF